MVFYYRYKSGLIQTTEHFLISFVYINVRIALENSCSEKGNFNMKKRTLIISLTCMLLVVAVVIGFAAFGGKKPFKDLDSAQITSATVHLAPPNTIIQIVEIKELVTYLKDVVIYNEDNSYREYNGQSVTFTLTMTDGTQISIMEYNPFLVIDGVGYKTKNEPCEALNNYANRLLKQ